ncbi:hypothetical protein B9Z55_021786 [Caenorhabditis nigoni]|uniref:RGS domain-containing protein n=1 Tax=Caenorhabditis nigoni TaxID=1611254 RepID=A0A2G5TTG8_9PELO|nr:hypothetical protein B9Z55_021786 [Caenorhabditis nigoni]
MSYFYPPKPPTLVTLAQVKFWGESLEQVISCPLGRWHFWSFCSRQPRLFKYLTFYISVYEWKRSSDERIKQSKALIIHEEWFRYASKMHISFDRPVLEKIYEKLKKNVVPRDVYDEAQQIVFEKMREISYPEYLRSPMYRELLAILEKEDEGKAVAMFP